MSIRVGLVCPYSLTVPGGVQAQVMGLATELRAQGHEARVLGPCDGPPPAPFVTPLGNSLPTAANGSIVPVAPDLAATIRTVRALRDESFDIVHVHEPLAPGAAITSVTMHSAPMVGTFHAAGRSAMYQIFGPILERFLARIDHRVVVSKDALALVQGYLGGEYEVLFNGVAVDEQRQAQAWPSQRPAVFFLGRHEQRKGLAVLLDAIARLDVEIECWVGGVGPDTEILRAQHRQDGRIQWLGRISDEEKLQRMRGAAVFCAPSLHGESFGVVLVEAMAANTPVVASSLAGYQNVATDGRDALLVPAGDAVALAAALQRVLTDAPLASQLVANGDRRADDFAMTALADRYIDIYRSLLSPQ